MVKEKITIRPFETVVTKAWTNTIMMAGHLHVMVHALDAKTKKLPNDLEVSATYADL